MTDAVDLARALVAALEGAGIDYAIGGALAYGFWGATRATSDVDVNVFVPDARAPAVLRALREAGCSVDEADALRRIRDRGDMVATAPGGMRVDVFFPSIPFHDEASRRRVRVPDLGGAPAWILSAEAIAVFKLLFFRGQDVVDLEHLVAAQGSRLDAAFVRRSIAAMVGEDDARVRRWDEIVGTFGPGGPAAG